MSWSGILALGVTLRPYDDPPPSGGVYLPFDAPLSSTLKILARELDALAAKTIVLQVGYRKQDLRLDGMPRSNSRMLHDAVALSFESKWGPLRYETNEFVPRSWGRGEGWEQNLRAIALGMEALRKVDRYGVSKRGEQYTGWRQLGSGAGDNSEGVHDRADAARAIHSVVGDIYDLNDILDDGSLGAGAHRDDAIREALKRTHPDRGGDAGDFRRVMRAKELLAG